MASVQCHKTCEQSCQQKSQHGSLGQKVSDMFKGHHNHHNGGTETQTQCYGSHHNGGIETQTQCYGQTHMLSQPAGNGATTKTTQTEYRCSQTQTTQRIATGTSSTRRCHGRSRREHRGNLLQKMKDGLSGHSSDSCSSSDGESDSDNENCHRRKNCN